MMTVFAPASSSEINEDDGWEDIMPGTGTDGSVSFTMIAAGGYHSLILRSDGTVWSWGWNNWGQLGDGTDEDRNRPVQVMISETEELTGVTAIAAGGFHSLAIRNDGTVWAWGNNNWGQLGDGTTVRRPNPVQVMINGTTPLDGVTAISAGGYHTLALTDGKVWGWGYNANGQLGNGSTGNTESRPLQVMINGTTPLDGVTAIAAGSSHSLASKSDGTVWSWGANNNGQLGDGTTVRKLNPVQVKISATEELTDVTAVTAGSHSLALKSDGTVWSWGYNNRGQLGDGTDVTRNRPVQVKVGATEELTDVTAISTFNMHSLALKSDGTMWAWGSNTSGQLGDGSTEDRKRPVQVMISETEELTGVTAISAGNDHSLALKNDGTAQASGWNKYGQLGIGGDDDRKVSVKIPDFVPPVPGGDKTIFATNASYGSLTLNWTKATDDTTEQDDILYYVYQKENSGFVTVNKLPADGILLNEGGTGIKDTDRYHVNGLSHATIYYFIVVAEDEAGNRAAYKETSRETPTVPGAPIGPEAAPGDGSAVLSWTAPDDGGSPITEYQISYGPSSGYSENWIGIPGSGAGTVTYTVTGLMNGTEYAFEVRAVNCAGEGGSSGTVNATPVTVPGAPILLTAASGDGNVTLSWTAPDGGGSGITGYEYCVDGGPWISVPDAGTTYTVTGLMNGTEYTFWVRAVNGIGEGPSSAVKATPGALPAAASRDITAVIVATAFAVLMILIRIGCLFPPKGRDREDDTR